MRFDFIRKKLFSTKVFTEKISIIVFFVSFFFKYIFAVCFLKTLKTFSNDIIQHYFVIIHTQDYFFRFTMRKSLIEFVLECFARTQKSNKEPSCKSTKEKGCVL